MHTSNNRNIPFNRPSVVGNELRYVAEAVPSGHISGDGPFTHKCSALMQAQLGVLRVLLTTSCTHALEMAAMLLELKPGDEVIVPAYTFVSTVNAFVMRGAKPVFADVRPDTLNIDEKHVASLVGPRTRAVVPVHYGGVGCAMDELLELAARTGLSIIEDNAHGLYGKYRGRFLGTMGRLGTQSFHETKNFSCGEGGALVVNDPAWLERAEILREKGTNRSRFFRGMVDKYTWVDIGSSYLPSDLLAAYLLAQLEKADVIQGRRRATWEKYNRELASWAVDQGVRLPVIPADCEQSYHMFYMLAPTLIFRQALIAYLKARGIGSAFHYLPLHLSDMGRGFGGKAGDCPVTERVAEQMIRLPFYNDLTEADQSRVIEAVLSFRR